MRWSSPMALATTCTSAPTRSQRFATSLIKDTLVARNALEVYLIISAVAMSVKTNGVSIKYRGRYRSRMIDRKSVGEGKRGDLGGRRIIKKKKTTKPKTATAARTK